MRLEGAVHTTSLAGGFDLQAGEAYRSHRWGAAAARRQWRMKRGEGVGDRAKRDRRFESYWHHANQSAKTGFFLGWL